MNKAIFSGNFKPACVDYLYLLNRGYPARGALELISNHYRLTQFQRVILFRGVFPDRQSTARRKRIITGYKGEALIIDCFNVLFTIANYLYGRTIFLATDGLLKDNGECFLKPQPGGILLRAIMLFVQFLADQPFPGAGIRLYLDQNFDHCSYIALELAKQRIALSLDYEILTVMNPDKNLQSATIGLLATTDSFVVDKSGCGIFDFACHVIITNFHPVIQDLRDFIHIPQP